MRVAQSRFGAAQRRCPVPVAPVGLGEAGGGLIQLSLKFVDFLLCLLLSLVGFLHRFLRLIAAVSASAAARSAEARSCSLRRS